MKIFIVGFVGFVGFVYFIAAVPLVPNYSTGERTGEIYKFSKKGIFWKSWEGEMYLGGVSKNSEGGLVLDKFYFSIPLKEENNKKEIIEKIKKCSEERNLCTVQYQQWLKKPIYQETRHIVENIK